MTLISPGAALSALRQTRRFVCAWCGKVFTAKDPRAKFCSNACRQADKYHRSKAAKESVTKPANQNFEEQAP